jgi:hypothetical protein
MQQLYAPDQSTQCIPLVRNDALSSRSERCSEADQFVSRWEPDTLVEHTRYTDPYAAWLNEHQSERYSATRTTARRAPGRFRRNQPPKAPWEAIPVTLSPDSL